MSRAGARLGLLLLSLLVLAAIAAPWLTPFEPAEAVDVVQTRFLPPGAMDVYGQFHLLGTDRLGRDVWTRLVFGARISLLVAGLATLVALSLGVLVGAAAALFRGPVGTFLLGCTDFALALPRVVLLLLLAALWQPSAPLVIVTLGLTGWMPIARLVYAESTAQLGRDYVAGARALGGSRWHLLRRHLLPHASPSLLAAATLGIGNAITLEAGLSFLGLGVQPPTPSWGGLIASGRDTIVNAPWVGLAPGIALVLVVVGCTLIADGLGENGRDDFRSAGVV